jgi:hypothetical protein
MSKDRIDTGSQGVEDLRTELVNRGFCQSAEGKNFRIEVKTSKSRGTQIPIQPHHVEGDLQTELVYVLVKSLAEDHIPGGYYFLTHEELKAAWTLMPRRSLRSGKPYSPKTRYLDWCLIRLHRNRW